MEIEIQKKPPKEYKKDIQVKSTTDVVELEEIKEIRNAMQENMILIGLDRGNHIRTLKLMGLGTNRYIEINSKDILRTALISGSESIILVHNHPSNSLKASSEDLHFTNITRKFLEVFNIQLLDHIIVTENEHLSMLNEKLVNKEYKDKGIDIIDKTLIIEENIKLKNENEKLKIMEEQFMNKYESVIIIKPTLTDEETKDTINKYKENFEKFSNQPVKVEDLGKKKLAYEIQGNKEGSYAVFTFYGKPEDISKTERQYRIDDNVMKFMTVKMDMEAEENPEAMEDEDEMEM